VRAKATLGEHVATRRQPESMTLAEFLDNLY
jgi:hypothetical protein